MRKKSLKNNGVRMGTIENGPRRQISFMKKDKLHFNFRKVDSYNKVFNFVISEREAG